MRSILAITLMLGACGAPADRLSDEQAAAPQDESIDAPLEIDIPPPIAAPIAAPPASYKAIGTEPGWALTITASTMRYQGDYGSVTISEPTPVGFRPAPGAYAGRRLKLTITPGPCSDGMSDLTYRHNVRLVADGQTVTGCGGGTEAPASLTDTRWIITAINGRGTPGGAGYFLAFTGTELSAQFGCNGMNGRYRVNGDHLSASRLVQTEMGCPEPAASFERIGSAVLNSNMRIERDGGETMRLVSEAGSIELKRAI